MGELARIWTQHTGSYSERELRVDIQPTKIVLLFLYGLITIAILYFIPPVRRFSGFHSPQWPVIVLVCAVGFSICLKAAWNRPLLRSILTLADSCCYVMLPVVIMNETTAPIRYVFGLLYGQCAVFYGNRYSFSLPMFVAICILPFGLSFQAWPDLGAIALVFFGLVMFIFNSQMTQRRRALTEQKDKLQSALTISDEIATRSMDIALASSLSEMGAFLHDLNNALTTVFANLKMLSSSVQLKDADQVSLDDALKGASRSADLIKRVMETIKRRGTVTEGTFFVDDEIAKALPNLRQQYDNFSFEMATNVPRFEVKGSGEHLAIVIENLARNAREAGATGVSITASVDGSSNQMTMEIADNGPGIPDGLREKILGAPISQDKYGARGFGLYISRRLVELLGGKLSLASSDGSGTTFSIRLPGRPGENPG